MVTTHRKSPLLPGGDLLQPLEWAKSSTKGSPVHLVYFRSKNLARIMVMRTLCWSVTPRHNASPLATRRRGMLLGIIVNRMFPGTSFDLKFWVEYRVMRPHANSMPGTLYYCCESTDRIADCSCRIHDKSLTPLKIVS
jgi:hypothetical protein